MILIKEGVCLFIYRNVALVMQEPVEPLGSVLWIFPKNLELSHVDDGINPHSLSLNENQ